MRPTRPRKAPDQILLFSTSGVDERLSLDDCDDMTIKKIVIFTGEHSEASTIEHVEAIVREFPDKDFCILQEFPRRRWRSSIESEVKRLSQEPISYPIELLSRSVALAVRRLRRVLPRGRAATCSGSVCFPESLASLASPNATYRRCSSFDDLETIDFVRSQGFWLGLSIGGPIPSPEMLKLLELGALDIRKGLPPGYRGMPPGFWELYDGVEKTGVSVHWIGSGLDADDVLCRREIPIPPFSTVRGLQVQLDALGTDVLLDALRRVDEGRRDETPRARTERPPNRRPSWFQAQALHRRLRRRRRLARPLSAEVRRAVKSLIMAAYVSCYAPVRNRLRSRRGRGRAAVILYHRVNDGYLDPLTVGVEQFDRQLAILKENYDVLDLKTFLANRGIARDRPAVLISFDDGYEDNYVAAVLLRRHGLPCAFFVSTGIVGTDRAFPHDLRLLGHRVPALAWSQVERMARWGFEIGNHTVDHTRISDVPLEAALSEVSQAKTELERRFGVSEATRSLAYPFGKRMDITEETRAGLPSIGVDYCLSAYGGANEPDFDRLNILRSAVDGSMSDLTFRAVVEGWSKPV